MLTPKTLLASLLLASAVFVSAAEKKKICFVSHLTSHGYGEHEYAAGAKLIGKWLEAAYPGQIETAYSINWPTNSEEFFKDADTVVFFCTGGDGHLVNNHVPEFDAVMKTGAGLACLHYAVEVPIGPSGKGMLDWMGGYFEKNWSVNPHWEAEFKVFPNHPVANGVKPFKMDDEWYFHMRFRGNLENVTPILSAEAPAATMSRKDGPHSGNPDVRKAVAAKEPQHVAWAYQRGADYNNGRGFGFTGLHYHRNWMQDSFRKTVLNGVAWTAKLEIPAGGVESPKPSIEELTKNVDETIGDKKQKKPLQPIKEEAPSAAAPAVPGGVKPLFSSAIVTRDTPNWAVPVDVELPAGSKELYLVVRDGGDGLAFDWANWAEAVLVLADGSEKKLSDLDWKSANAEWGKVTKNKNAGGQDMRIQGKPVEHGVGTHANSVIAYDLPAGAKRFKARAGLDNSGVDQGGPSSVQFLIFNQNPQIFLAANTSAAGGDKGNAAHDPANAIAGLKINPDLDAQLFAFEPDILSPSAIDVDEKGRIWVCEVVNYRRRNGERPAGDRILILEDSNGDAKADKTTVFHQGRDIDSAHGICVLGNRVIVSAGEEIFSLYDDNNDGKSDRKELMFTKIGGSQHDHGIHAMHFGPDGRLYFNFGNAGQRLCDAKGELITDINGVKITNQNNRPFQEGMVFRCELDGSRVEVLGWNFRNNWEIAVDSFGTVWQSDNDDDGNQGVRINYVMEYGNYGYKDELTGGGWRDARPGIEQEIPKRHWHLNDPGVVPNLLQTGAGSPTGICVYEGSLLPERFLGQPIHCDAGPNVVRAYLAQPEGAGYYAVVEDILNGTANRWFRPSDIVVAPDGSLIVADWYDPGVGGHAMGDVDRGRLFRVAPKGNNTYKTPETKSALQGLASPNEARRYLAWQELDKSGKASEGPLSAIFTSNAKPYLRARSLWLLARLDNGMDHLNKALGDADANIRITALRAVRYLHPAQLTPVLEKLAADANPQVRREVALAIRYDKSNSADQIWVKLASQYDGKDRWYLEALGIAADLTWNTRFTAINTEVHDDIVWRSRAENSAALIADRLIAKPDAAENVKYLRALQFQPDPAARSAAYQDLFTKGKGEAALFAAAQLGSGEIAKLPEGPQRLESILAPVRGTAEFVSVVDRLNLRGFETDLANYIAAHPNAQEAPAAAQVILRSNQTKLSEITGQTDTPDNRARAVAVLTALGRIGDRDTTRYLSDRLGKAAPDMQREYVSALAISGNGGRELISLAEKRALPENLQFLAAAAIARSPDAGLRSAAQGKFRVPPVAGGENLPPVHDLMAMKANASAGKPAFTKAACITCHKVAGEGIDFGPDLTQIGNKLSKEAMFEAILFPSVAISHGFQGVVIQRKSGDGFSGFITGETDTEVTLRLPGGISQAFKKDEIAQRKEMDMSLMPPGLAAALTAQELADLVAYMQSLK